MKEMGVKDYISILTRNWKYFTVSFFLVLILSFVFTLNYDRYKSTVTVQIQSPEIAENIASLTFDGAARMAEALADQRINQIQQRVTSTSGLIEVINKLNLYPEDRKRMPLAEVAADMRKKIQLDMVSTSLANPTAAQRASAGQLSAIAFNLTFAYDDPLKAQQTTDELISRFLDEDLKQRRVQATETNAFIAYQVTALEKTLEEQDKKIAEFRARNPNARPESLAFNQQMLASTESSLREVNTRISSLEKQRGDLKGQLALVQPYSMAVMDGQVLTSPDIQLKALRSQLAILKGQYSERHPDVIRVEKQIQLLQKQVRPTRPRQDTSKFQSRLIDAETRLKILEETRSPDHPDIQNLKGQIAQLKQKIATSRATSMTDEMVQDADNPTYLMIVSQIQATEASLAPLLDQRTELERQIQEYQRSIAEIPKVEEEFSALTRDYENTMIAYRELRARQLSAEMSEKMEADHKGERLVVINPPELPTDTSPGRKMLLLAGIFLATLSGIGTVFVIEILSSVINGQNHYYRLTGTLPLVSIPYLYTERERQNRKRHLLYIAGATVAFITVVLGSFHLLIMPLEVAWTLLLRKFGIY
ncbi:hypothetical protein IHV25_04735 [Phaeovibrio sulfidiphilus]|uniref:Lipopolysaccharide biosynthesis protein n=1 Tax=Phaeovibrio sulfidiphilus TaxID=1220600 RepID=A0A8J6YPN5_9PROT|nr:hypothetical protein [Phaeovibrio sulfidiphilus]MBE1236952.1 hypothetical protein [Phaeovibrio sulfidiphilus]